VEEMEADKQSSRRQLVGTVEAGRQQLVGLVEAVRRRRGTRNW
jgi:hypothetical protein